ncbi:DUF3267 domain-containing protein [Rummeliibacillus suwonensis]|uniref:DUF3267 domain-containing protein n=1 Tax=Rummeliibacillus suwonensis TaxID=1306154 RepID=UPI0011B6BBDB|nr:DUF3267 domain-containing protein [Rummeliibacillus suwonensis]MBO2535164.1 DUF3267 domain-containing protein [Rummeliibacillus suwonensis]
MHCWKTINVQRQYGHNRIFLFSIIFVLMVFSIFYISITAYKDCPVSDRLFPLFVLVLLMIYPVHKFLHFLPLIHYRHRLRFSIEKQFKLFPVLAMRIHEPILKSRYVIALIIPFIVLNSTFITCAIIFPDFRHYFAILLAYHCGLCVVDLLYVKQLIRSPKKALIEETDKGFEILILPSNK